MTLRDEMRENIIMKGICLDEMNAIDALEVCSVIGTFHDSINKAGYGLFFGEVQSHADHIALISLRKLFERPGNRHQIRSIPSMLRQIRANASDLQPEHLPCLRQHLDFINADLQMLQQCYREGKLEHALDVAENEAPSENKDPIRFIDSSLARVRKLANQEVAHNEEAQIVDRATYDDCWQLLGYVKDIFSIIIDPIFGIESNGGRVLHPHASLMNLLSVVLGRPIDELWSEHDRTTHSS